MKLIPKKFSITNDKILYDNELIVNSNDIYSFEHLKFLKSLGNGANGITFLTIHRYLNEKQVVKIYLQSKDFYKDLNESQKNANHCLREYSLRVFDAGILKIEHSYFLYTIMEYKKGDTLGNWCKYFNDLYSQARSEKGRRNIIQAEINIASKLVIAFATYASSENTHGDLNEGNIMIDFNKSKNSLERDLLKRNSPGVIEDIDLYLLDAGTSRQKDTNREYGQGRDAAFLLDNTRWLLIHLFESKKQFFKCFRYLKITSGQVSYKSKNANRYFDQNISLSIAAVLLRIFGFTTFLLGQNNDSRLKDDEMEDTRINASSQALGYMPARSILNGILSSREETSRSFLDYELYNPYFIIGWNKLHNSSLLDYELFDWNKFLKILEKRGLKYLNGFSISEHECSLIENK